MISRKHKKVCATLHYIEHFLILASAITGCVSISAFASLLVIPIRITSSSIGLKICTIAEGIKTYKSIIQKKKKYDKIVLLAKSKLNSTEVLISKALIDSNIGHDEFVLIHAVLKICNNMKEEFKDLKTKSVYYFIFKTMLSYCFIKEESIENI